MDIRKYFHLSLTVFHLVRTIFKVLQDQRQLVKEVAIKITSNYCDSTSAINENLHLSLWAPPAWWKCSCGSTLLFKWKVFGGFHDHGHCHVQRNERLSMIFNIFQLHLPDICVAIPAGVSNLKNWYWGWNAQVERVNARRMAIHWLENYFSIQRLIGARMCFVCVPPLLKAPLLLADWLPARNLRVSFSFSLKSLISSMDAC